MTPPPLRVLIADDAPLLRQAVTLVLEAGGLEVVAQLQDAVSIPPMIAELEPDVAVIDLRMPPLRHHEGLQAALWIKEFSDRTGVVLLSQHVDLDVARTLFSGGVPSGLGYLMKERAGSVDTFVEAVRTVADGGCVLDPEIVAAMMARTERADPLARLTGRERQVLGAMAEGLSNLAISRRLDLSERTVETYIASIFVQLGLQPSAEAHRRVHAVLMHLGAHPGAEDG